MFGGGFGNGKTAAACIKAIQLVLDYPGSNGLIARETYPKLNDTIRAELYKWLDKSLVKRWPTREDNTLTFHNGSVINFRYVMQRGRKSADGTTTSNLLSATYDWVIVDQVEDPGIKYKDFLDLWGRLRGSTPYKGDNPRMPITGPRIMILTTNPTNNWVYGKLIKPYHKYQTTGLVGEDLIADPDTSEPLIEVFEGSTYENQHNLDRDFIKMLEATYKGQMKSRFLMGKWGAYEGLVYPQFERSVHMIPRTQVKDILSESLAVRSQYSNVEGFDLGLVQPSCYLHGFVDYRGRIIICEGHHRPGPDTDTIGGFINRTRNKHYDYIDYDRPIYSDPSIFKKSVMFKEGQLATTYYDMIREKTGARFAPAQNSIESGIVKVSSYLNSYDGMGLDGQRGPLIYFADDLDFIEDEITNYFWQSNPEGERLDKPRDENDHAMDTLKYCLSRIPDASEILVPIEPPIPEYMKWHEHGR